ncbi:hypothetical protein E4582_10100 [Luteimonas yindakuii]|uniref:Uncharacterized protein n=1 Tax=Luteimonas yindakuii TaxID=2565782 RepID=A0A4Z1RE22_9GAMM|nr:hypothetical protein [Luteimonas yindakuii]TKS55078.1 hypothetical protein E4582_10100 [Luteimonas yindakuii]
MTLQALLAEVEPDWFRDGGEPLPPDLLRRARASRLGRRLLARGLIGDGAVDALLAPRPGHDPATIAMRWPKARVERLARDLGVLAHGPAIRGEVRREPVRRLKRALGNSYLLALDPSVWDAQLPPAVVRELGAGLEQALVAGGADDDAPLLALFARQGRQELRAWAAHRDPALGEWVALLHPREPAMPTVLPERPVLLLCTHHETRAAKA